MTPHVTLELDQQGMSLEEGQGQGVQVEGQKYVKGPPAFEE